MNWFKSAFNYFSKNETPMQRKNASLFVGGNEGLFSYSNTTLLSIEGYVLNSCVRSTVDLIVKAIIQNKLIVIDKNDAEAEPLDNPLMILLNNPDTEENQSLNDWLTEYFVYLLVFGDGLIYKIAPSGGNSKGKPSALKVMSTAQIQILTKLCAYGYTLDKYQFANNLGFPIDPADVLHGKCFNPNNQVLGLSPLMSCGLNVDLINEVHRWNVSLLQNGVNPTGIYTSDNELTPGQFTRLKKQIDENSGAKNAGREKLIEGGLKYQQIGISPKDTDFNAGILLAKREVASVYGIAPQLIGDSAGQTFANYEQAILSLHNDVAYPLLQSLVSRLNVWLTPYYGENLIIKIDNSKVGAIQEQKQKAWDKIDKSSELTINEKRLMKGLPPVENGDVIVIGGKTLDQIIKGDPFMAPGFNAGPKIAEETEEVDDVDPEPEAEPEPTKAKNLKIKKAEFLDIQFKAMTKADDQAIKESRLIVDGYFDYQAKEIGKNLSGSTTAEIMDGVESAIKKTTPALKEVYNIIYKDIAFDSAVSAKKEAYQNIHKRLDMETKAKIGLNVSLNVLAKYKKEFGKVVDEYFKDIKLGELITDINETTRVMVQGAVEAGVKNGDDITKIGESIQGIYKNEMTDYRAERIARTETLRGTSFAGHKAQGEINPGVSQRWLPSHDDRVRPTTKDGKYNHRTADIANGDVPLNIGFVVSGEKMLFPRDTSLGAKAGNVINCRCSVGYIDPDFAEFYED